MEKGETLSKKRVRLLKSGDAQKGGSMRKGRKKKKLGSKKPKGVGQREFRGKSRGVSNKVTKNHRGGKKGGGGASAPSLIPRGDSTRMSQDERWQRKVCNRMKRGG